jgi:hypothetical protein
MIYIHPVKDIKRDKIPNSTGFISGKRLLFIQLGVVMIRPENKPLEPDLDNTSEGKKSFFRRYLP